MTPRLPPFLRSPVFWLLLGVFAAEFWLFDQYGARRHTAVYPRWHDQVQYLSEAYTGYEFARSRGVLAGLLNALTNSSAQGTLHDFFAIVVFLFAGPSRSAALSVNLLALIAWQIAIYLAVSRSTRSRPLALASMMLPLALTGPWENIPGSAYDFRLDHMAMCGLGISAAAGVLTNGFESRRASGWFGIAVGLTILTRFITGTYFVLIFLGLAAWIYCGADRKNRGFNLLRAGLFASVLAVPFLWLNYEVLREYYWIGHYVGPESAIRNPNLGLIRSFRFVTDQLAVRHLGWFFGAVALAGAIVLTLMRSSTRETGSRSLWIIGALFMAAPMVILTFHPQKSAVVVSALVPGVIVLVIAAWDIAARRANPVSRWILASGVMLAALAFYTRAQTLVAYPPSIQADIRRVNTLADQIFSRSTAANLKPARISVDYVTDAFDAYAFRVIVYERKRVWIPFDIRLPTGIAEPSDALVMERLKESDFVFLTESDSSGIYPFDRKLAAMRPTLRAWCDANLRGVERFTLLGRSMVLYQKREIPFP
jgi:hypothetical protein